MRWLMGGLADRAEKDSGRQMSCQAKATPISHRRMVKIEKFGPQELLQHDFERVWVWFFYLFVFLN